MDVAIKTAFSADGACFRASGSYLAFISTRGAFSSYFKAFKQNSDQGFKNSGFGVAFTVEESRWANSLAEMVAASFHHPFAARKDGFSRPYASSSWCFGTELASLAGCFFPSSSE